MSKQFRVSYYLRSNYKNKEGKTPVMARVYLGKEKITLSTGINVIEDLWDAKAGHLKGKTANTLTANLKIDQYTSRFYSLYNTLSSENADLTVEKYKAALSGKVQAEVTTLLQVSDKYIENFKAQVGITRKRSTLGKYETTKTRLKDFIE